MDFCKECLRLIDYNLSQSDRFILQVIAENEISNKEDIIGMVKVLAKREEEEIITSKSGISSILNKLEGALLINVDSVGRQKLYSINNNGKQVLKGVTENEN
ncbi:hypothetical protein JCM16358_08940 [Halanaerocella petrolearia]